MIAYLRRKDMNYRKNLHLIEQFNNEVKDSN